MIAPLRANADVLDFLMTRRSRPAKTLTAPAPDRETLLPLLTAAARTPDHGKLEPWRFIVLKRAALDRIARDVEMRGRQLEVDPDKLAKTVAEYRNSPLAVVVVSAPKPSEKIPQIEQVYSAGAVCLALVNACLAAGWGANWLSGWASHDETFRKTGFGLSDSERIAGVIHIGTEGAVPPERPRPDVAALTSWVDV
ncbi:MAG: nitroreductase [Dinoroseobacter sp.]|nr:nitroreductase [Dinoroseobacter sp.]